MPFVKRAEAFFRLSLELFLANFRRQISPAASEDLSMKVFQLVGARKSGKTTTAEILIGSLKARGYRVGTVKSIGCPRFTMDERRDSNTARHRRAGADAVVALSKNETDFMYPRKLDLEDVLLTLSREGLDYCIVEGGYEYDLPRIVCFRSPEEIPERVTEKTFALSGAGVAATGGAHALSSASVFAAAGARPCPALSALSDPAALTDLLERAVPEMVLPVARIPRPESCRGFCRGCSGHERSRVPENTGASGRCDDPAIESERGTSGITPETTEPLKD
jgi:molybdopterin-guanine dinucleotide biosynthesis protein B